MAAQQGTTPSAPASIVGNAFVIRYYNILHQSPHLVYRFYTDSSRLSRAEAWPNATVDSVTTLGGIHEKIMSLESGSTRAEIMSVDSQESLAGNVLVMVTGALYSANGVKRTFVQTFVLAPQDKSYFVVNDMFRYLDGDGKISQPASPLDDVPDVSDAILAESDEGLVEAIIQPETQSAKYPSPEVHEQNVASHDHESSENAEVPIAEGAEDNSGAQQVIVSLAETKEVQVSAEEMLVDAPKKSYASILRVQSSKVMPTHTERTASSVSHLERSTSLTTTSQATSQLSNGIGSSHDNTDSLEAEGDRRAVYVKNLPLNVTVSELEVEFSKFGQLRAGGVNLRNQKAGVCFAFIDFEDASAAQTAIEASPISMGSRLVHIEGKKVNLTRAGRGRFIQGRGYQNDVARGRGYFNSRGMGRGASDVDKEFGRGRGMSGRGGYGGNMYSSNVSNSSYSYRALDAQNGNSFRPVRRGARNEMGRNVSFARNDIAVAAA